MTPGRPPTAMGGAGGYTGHGHPGHAGSGTEIQQGVVLGKYQIVRQLGSGGMGAVYEAVHTSIGKAVALKTMNPALASDPRAEARFMREAAAASRLGHPNVCDVTDFGADQGVVYIVMELLRGEDLSSLVAHAPAGLDASFVADVMLAVCAGVYAAHEKGVVHRDLKPQNIFLSRTPLGDVVPKVLDFGISKLLDDAVDAGLTNSGSVMGTTHYLSPEQVTGANIDGRSDEFALGVILYECLTGQRPHQGDTIFTIMRAISEGRFPRPRALRPDLLPALEAVILRAMALRPDDRYPTVHALGNGLLPFASPKGRVLWADYFSRPPAGSLGTGHLATQAHQYSSAGQTSVMSAAGPFGGDTRSGVAPVSVLGTSELAQRRGEQARRSRARGFLFGLAGAAAAVAAVVILRPPLGGIPTATTPPAPGGGIEVPKPVVPAPAAPVAAPPGPVYVPPTPATPEPEPVKAAPPIRRQLADADDDKSDDRDNKRDRARARPPRANRDTVTPVRRAPPVAPARPPVTRAKPTTPRPPEKPQPTDADDLYFEGPRRIPTPGRAPILD